MFATQFDSRYAGINEFHYDYYLVLQVTLLVHTLPLTSCSKKYTDLIGSILEGSGPTSNGILFAVGLALIVHMMVKRKKDSAQRRFN